MARGVITVPITKRMLAQVLFFTKTTITFIFRILVIIGKVFCQNPEYVNI